MKKINWGIASQILAAASVVLSLSLVAFDIGQNISGAKATATQAFTQQIIDIRAVQAGVIDEGLLVQPAQPVVTPFFSPHFVESWPTRKLNFTTDFVQYFEGRFQNFN